MDPRQPGNLPAELTPLIGRRAELARAKLLMNDTRLLTMNGVAGVGKTRLAMALAGSVRRAFGDSVWFIDLAPVSAPDLVAQTVVTVLGLDRETGDDPLTVLVNALANRSALLVLDNCEHLLGRCAEIAQVVLRSAANVRIVATSRAALTVPGEQVMPVGPLSLPPVGKAPLRLDALRRFDAVALFEQRVKGADPDFRLQAANAVAVTRLCHRLDGLPLALELAASAVPALGLAEVERRLGDRLRVLATSQVAGRHSSLQAALEWSYDLCTPAERLLWARSSVFAGPFTLQAAEQVCADESLGAEWMWEAIAGLVAKSVVTAELAGDQCRYRLLETVRAYGRERLESIGERTSARQRHRDWVLELAEQCSAESLGPSQMQWLDRLPEQHSNLRAALEFCATEPGEGQTGLRLMSALWLYWMARKPGAEVQHWFDRLLSAAPEPSAERAEALWWSLMFALLQDDMSRLYPRAAECEEIARQYPGSLVSPMGTLAAGYVAMSAGDYAAAEGLVAAAIEEFDAVGGGEKPAVLVAYTVVAFCAAGCGGYDRAERWFRKAELVCAKTGDRYLLSGLRWVLATARLDAGFPEEAAEHARESLRLQRELRDTRALITINLLSQTAAMAGRHTDAAVLIGAVEHLEEAAGLGILNLDYIAQARAACRTKVLRALGDTAFNASVARGRSLDMEEVVAFALDESPSDTASAEARTVPLVSPLTPRENQVAELIGAGLSNKQIAAKLFIALRTTESHVEHIMAKLQFTSRAQIAVWAAVLAQQGAASGPE